MLQNNLITSMCKLLPTVLKDATEFLEAIMPLQIDGVANLMAHTSHLVGAVIPAVQVPAAQGSGCHMDLTLPLNKLNWSEQVQGSVGFC
jgi:hypothetical protein